MSDTAEAVRWRQRALSLYEHLAKHARSCDLCQWSGPSGARPLVSTGCRGGMLFLTEWVTACCHHHNALTAADRRDTTEQDHRLMRWPE